MNRRKILFLTGTRADYSKLKPLMSAVNDSSNFEYTIFVTGMHTLAKYGSTMNEIKKSGFKNIHIYMNQRYNEPMDLILANTINGLSRYVSEYSPDLIVIHGDRVEALAGAIVGSLNNLLVAHVEGGELSGTVDELIRHSVSKLAHVHFVSNKEAANRLKQMGEIPSSIFEIGSPDIDIMLSSQLPNIDEVKKRYEIEYDDYGIVLFHPVTTELDYIYRQAIEMVSALVQSKFNYIVIYPNNDSGSHHIFRAYEEIVDNPNFKIFPSIRFEYFLTLLKNSKFIIGNSSVGIHEAPVYGIPSINIGSRQENRFTYESIINVTPQEEEIITFINRVIKLEKRFDYCYYFGHGESAKQFINVLEGEQIWNISRQKMFQDIVEQ